MFKKRIRRAFPAAVRLLSRVFGKTSFRILPMQFSILIPFQLHRRKPLPRSSRPKHSRTPRTGITHRTDYRKWLMLFLKALS